MKHIFLIGIIVLLIIPTSIGQNKYVCIYTDTLRATLSKEQKDSIYGRMEKRGIPDEIIDAIFNNVYYASDAFLTVQKREVVIRNDSAFLQLQYKNNPGRIFLVRNSKALITKGKLFSYNDTAQRYIPSIIPDSSQVFSPIGKFVNILGYRCEEFESLDKCYKIWVTKDLPSSINPGVAVQNVKGAILGFEYHSEKNAITRSVVRSINKEGVREL